MFVHKFSCCSFQIHNVKPMCTNLHVQGLASGNKTNTKLLISSPFIVDDKPGLVLEMWFGYGSTGIKNLEETRKIIVSQLLLLLPLQGICAHFKEVHKIFIYIYKYIKIYA